MGAPDLVRNGVISSHIVTAMVDSIHIRIYACIYPPLRLDVHAIHRTIGHQPLKQIHMKATL